VHNKFLKFRARKAGTGTGTNLEHEDIFRRREKQAAEDEELEEQARQRMVREWKEQAAEGVSFSQDDSVELKVARLARQSEERKKGKKRLSTLTDFLRRT
jgi:tRNA A37 threonylcarbamoyladenosine biosynthesis protein TsaE